MHTPVLLEESLNWLNLRPDGVYVDATLGLGGHTAAIAARLANGIVIGCDRDPDSIELARANTALWAERIRYCQAKFSELSSTLPALGYTQVDGILADLGVSRVQLTQPERGFSLMADGPLDMRMDRSQPVTAADYVNHMAEKALSDLIFQLGEERRSRRIARAIVRARPIRSTLHLAEVVESAVPRTGRIHPATRVFLALRRAVNQEQEELEALLQAAPALVKPGGRIVVISFMSIEDRTVKQAFQALARQGRARILTKHVITPSEGEVQQNPASRSAKLRALEMT
jgi:16S rRNA (cytosine1402-N4)-methyltransferase